MRAFWKIIFVISVLNLSSIDASEVTRQRRSAYITFPEGTYMGLLYALAIPLDKPNKNVMLSYNFEANYFFESNHTGIIDRFAILQDPDDGSTTRTSTDQIFSRKLAYHVIQSKMDKHGYPGRACLLRTICEATASALDHNGILGELISIIFRPSMSTPEELPIEFDFAEKNGSTNNCTRYHQDCNFSLLDAISFVLS